MPLIFEAETSTTCSEENGEVCQMLWYCYCHASQRASWCRPKYAEESYMMSLSHLSSATFVFILPLDVSWVVSMHCQMKELQ
jgi:hypothetical protein